MFTFLHTKSLKIPQVLDALSSLPTCEGLSGHMWLVGISMQGHGFRETRGRSLVLLGLPFGGPWTGELSVICHLWQMVVSCSEGVNSDRQGHRAAVSDPRMALFIHQKREPLRTSPPSSQEILFLNTWSQRKRAVSTEGGWQPKVPTSPAEAGS